MIGPHQGMSTQYACKSASLEAQAFRIRKQRNVSRSLWCLQQIQIHGPALHCWFGCASSSPSQTLIDLVTHFRAENHISFGNCLRRQHAVAAQKHSGGMTGCCHAFDQSSSSSSSSGDSLLCSKGTTTKAIQSWCVQRKSLRWWCCCCGLSFQFVTNHLRKRCDSTERLAGTGRKDTRVTLTTMNIERELTAPRGGERIHV